MPVEESKIPPPVLLSAIICDKVIMDAVTRQPSIISVLGTISAPKYPARHSRLAFFCELTNGRGKTPITVRLVDVKEEEKTLFEQTVEIEFKDVRQVVNVTFGIEGLVFPHSGEYRFQIFAGTHFRGDRRVICRQIKLPSGDKSDE